MAVNNFLAVGTSWNDGANWSLGTVPTGADVATFNGSSGNCSIDVNVAVGGIALQATYINTLTQLAGFTLSVGTLDFIQDGGIFLGGDSLIIFNDSSSLNAGVFTSTSGELKFKVSAVITNTFNHNNGLTTISFPNSNNFSVGSTVLYDLRIESPIAWITVNADLSVSNDFTLTGINYFNGGNILVGGNVVTTASNMKTTSGGQVIFVGVNQTVNAGGETGALHILTINNTGTLTASGTLKLTAGSIYTAGNGDFTNCDIILTGTSSINFPSMSLKSLEFDTGNNWVTLFSDVRVLGLFNANSINRINGFSLYLEGDMVNSDSLWSAGSTQIVFDGTTDQTYTSSITTSLYNPYVINKASGNFILGSDFDLKGSGSDFTINQGNIIMGAFNMVVNDMFTMNAGAVTSTTGIFTANRFNLQDGVFDPSVALSVSNSSTTLFTDSATVSLMPSGGNFTFEGSNHWTIDQNFTEFPHLIIDKCTTCNQTGTFYTKDLTLKNNTKWGAAFISGNVISDGFSNYAITAAQTFNGVGIQTVTGGVYFGRLQINKISGSLVFNDDFRVTQMEVIAGAALVDLVLAECRILNSGGHLISSDWVVTGLEFGSIVLEISTGGNAILLDTVTKTGFTVIQCNSLSGDITVGGDLSIQDTSYTSSFTLKLNGASDQDVFVAGTSNDGMNRLWEIDKPSGVVKLQSDVITTDVLSHLHLINGIICTNGYDITTEDLTLDGGTAIQKVSPTVVTVNGTTTNNGAIVDVQGCNTGITV